jgi:hypothetical protein
MTRGQRRGAFNVDAVEGPRFELAIELLTSGRAFEFHDVTFRTDDGGALLCIVDSSWGVGDTTPETATKDLEEGRVALEYLLEAAPAFASAVRGRPVRYELIEDYGNGSVLICTKVDDAIVWAHGLPKSAG